jgi:hypothetical protein
MESLLFELQHTFKKKCTKWNVSCDQSTRYYSASVTYTTRVGCDSIILTKKAHCCISISRSPITPKEKLRHLLELE